MKTNYGILDRDISVKGFPFKKDTLLRIWDTGSVTSIQPFFIQNELHKAMWYLLCDGLGKHITRVDPKLCEHLYDELPIIFS